jgi:cob(I)alamin adenosyltransferase
MPRITKVYTRTGDDGRTRLATAERVDKDSLRVSAYGSVDELSSHLGLAVALGPSARLRSPLQVIQNELFHLGAQLATPGPPGEEPAGPSIEDRHVESLERLMDELSARLEPLENFVLPGGSSAAAALHVARAVCRRAERDVVALARQETVAPVALRYLNRLSDALFVLARAANREAGVEDVLWDSRA